MRELSIVFEGKISIGGDDSGFRLNIRKRGGMPKLKGGNGHFQEGWKTDATFIFLLLDSKAFAGSKTILSKDKQSNNLSFSSSQSRSSDLHQSKVLKIFC